MKRIRITVGTLVAGVAIGAALTAGASTANAGTCIPLAFPISISTSGTTGTGTFSVRSGCGTVQVSLVAVSYAGGTGFIYDSATGFFTGGPSFSLSVNIPCGTNGELDLVLGPPALFPSLDLDMRAVPFNVPCVTTPGPGTLTIGYWKNHPNNWPVSSVTVGGGSISEAAAIDILNTPPRGDATIILADQLIAAELNVALGNTSSCVSSTIAAANTLLAAHPVGSNLRTGTTDGATAVSLGSTLDNYNNGGLCAPHQP